MVAVYAIAQAQELFRTFLQPQAVSVCEDHSSKNDCAHGISRTQELRALSLLNISCILVLDTMMGPLPDSRLLCLLLHWHLITRQMVKPPFHLFLYRALDRTRVHLRHSLRLQNALHTGRSTGMEHAAVVHRTLQTISLPPKDIVSMCAVSLAVRVAPHERLRAIFGPHVSKHGRIPHCLVRELRHLDRVRRWTWACWSEAAFGRGEHVRLVVWRVEILPIPAAREVVDCHYTSRAWTSGEVLCLKSTGEDRLETSVRKALFRAIECICCWIPYSHAESLGSHQLSKR